METSVFVYLDLDGKPNLVGRLWTRVKRERESASFEYDKDWLANPARFSLEPNLPVSPGPFHTASDQPLFGAIGDSAPDRWGRVLMRRAAKRQADSEKKTVRTLFESDYLLMVNDETRQGALRFAQEENGPFLAPQGPDSVPPLIEIPRLLSAADNIEDDTETAEDLRLLLAPGSSLGGARPKASVRDRDGHLCIAKFPNKGDETNIVLGEALALTLAERSGITVPQWRVESVGSRSVLLLRRFDRDGKMRIPFLSAMSMLGARDNEPHSYLEFVDALRQSGAAPKDDMHALWRRVVFNVLISNTDDHLRNHGFLYAGPTGWRLAPAYDLNPVPVDLKPRVLSTAIMPEDHTASLALAYDVADYFGLRKAEVSKIAGEVGQVVSGWRKEALGLGLTDAEIGRMASAFEHKDLEDAVKEK